MRLEEILQSTQRLPAPESLKQRVMAAVEADTPAQAGRGARLRSVLGYRPLMVMAACAAALLLAVWLAPGSVSPPIAPGGAESVTVTLMEVNFLLEETLEKVYGFESIKDSAEYRMEEDETGFINNNLELIFRMNGGSNA